MLSHPEKSGFVAVKIRSKGWVRPPGFHQSANPPYRVTKVPVLINTTEQSAWIKCLQDWCEENLETFQVFELSRPRFI